MIKDNDIQELFIGIASSLGSNSDIVVHSLKNELETYGYTVFVISIKNDIIKKIFNEIDNYSETQKKLKYIELGNKLRDTYKSKQIMAALSLGIIKSKREKCKGNTKIAFIIKSFKNNEEINLFRKIYGEAFYLIGVSSSVQYRLENLKRSEISQKQANELIELDNTKEIFHKSDYFIVIKSRYDNCLIQVERFLKLVFGHPYSTPTFDEHAMFIAFMSSLRSADLSRQVGASIGLNNQIIAMGSNDCPQFGGGIYWPYYDKNGEIVDVENGRDYKIGYDYNKIQLDKLANDIANKLSLEDEEKDLIKNTNLKDIIDYCRPVHAEMEALLSCARSNISCKDATMYVTTFPCHNCAKHILAAGIKKVFFIEPYPKSKTLEMYSNEITILDNEENKKCLFKVFEGVGPNRYIDFFSMNTLYGRKKRKNEDGTIIRWSKTNARQISSVNAITYKDAEDAAVDPNINSGIDELWKKIL